MDHGGLEKLRVGSPWLAEFPISCLRRLTPWCLQFQCCSERTAGSVLRAHESPARAPSVSALLCERPLLLQIASVLRIVWLLAERPQPLIAVSLAVLGSTSSALPIQSTLLHRISTCPSVPELTPFTNSSVLESWMFMYRSTETSLPLYSVSPHLRRTTMSLSTLRGVSRGRERLQRGGTREARRTSSGGAVGG